jgi:AcrR family transcriptional regulator
MPRVVDQQRFTERQTVILAAAYRCFAAQGFEGTSTADVCRAARVSSGTLFHYFPTKIDILLTLLRASAAWTEEQLHRATRTGRGKVALAKYLTALDREHDADRQAGFARAVHGAAHLPEVSAVLVEEAELVDRFLLEHITEAVRTRAARTDVPPEHLARWTRWIIDGEAVDDDERRTVGRLSAAVRSLLDLG